jgi:hypothetical protein
MPSANSTKVNRRARGGDHDEKRHHSGEPHADQRVEADARELARRLLGRRAQAWGAAVMLPVLDFLLRLPEKEVRAEGGPECREHGQQVLRAR